MNRKMTRRSLLPGLAASIAAPLAGSLAGPAPADEPRFMDYRLVNRGPDGTIVPLLGSEFVPYSSLAEATERRRRILEGRRFSHPEASEVDIAIGIQCRAADVNRRPLGDWRTIA